MSATTARLRVHTLIDSLTWGGAEILLGDLAAGAPAAGIDLSVAYLHEINGSPAAVRLRKEGVEPQLVPTGRLLDPRGLDRLRRHLRSVQPDVVHTHLLLADLLGTLAARSLGVPSVSTVHLIARNQVGQAARGRRRRIVKEDLAGLVRRRAGARVIAVSDAARDAYLATGWDAPERVVTVHNGIARSAPAEDGSRVRSELGIAEDALVLSIVTVLRRDKGHAVVVEAVRRLSARFPGLRLLILGDGPAREEVRRLAQPLGATALLTGHRDDVLDVLRATDVLVHPTSMDAFPTTLLEAAAVGVPVLATAVGGIPEIVRDGITGFLLPAPPTPDVLADKLAPLLDDAALRRDLGAQAQLRFNECFTAERWAQRLRRVYDEALATSSA